MEAKVRRDWRTLTETLIRRQLTITTMESATAGQLASLITDTEGSSAVLHGAFVTYCNEAKILQGVPAEVISKYTVYSKETACAMADAAGSAYDADIAIGVTGTMGNVDPANPDASQPGDVYYAFCFRKNALKNGTDARTVSYHIQIAPQETRLAYKLAVAGEIVKELLAILNAS